jgi:hypothetical protein
VTTVRLIGDVHGKFGRYRDTIRDASFSIQVGDMGVGFKRMFGGELVNSANPPFDAMSEGRHLFIRGNHDNPEVCKSHKYWIPDGTVVDGIYCLGGATSIDRAWRTEGLDWWEDEQLSYSELQKCIDDYATIKPEIVVTHEAPESIANQILATFNMTKIEDASRTRQALEQMFYAHQPREWYFGHWHTSMQFKSGQTLFRCLAELEYADVEI